MPGPFPWGEAGGILAGATALLVAIGAGVKWLFGWRARRADSFHAKLVAWERSLREREGKIEAEQKAHFARIERRLDQSEDELKAALTAYLLVAGRLRVLDAGDGHLQRADELLRTTFRLDPDTPTEMLGLLARIRRTGE